MTNGQKDLFEAPRYHTAPQEVLVFLDSHYPSDVAKYALQLFQEMGKFPKTLRFERKDDEGFPYVEYIPVRDQFMEFLFASARAAVAGSK